MHQQVAPSWPEAMAHWLGWPQSGQRVEDMGASNRLPGIVKVYFLLHAAFRFTGAGMLYARLPAFSHFPCGFPLPSAKEPFHA